MIPRYSRPEMSSIWTEQAKYDRWLEVEIAVCAARAKTGEIPAEAVDRIKKGADFDINDIAKYQAITHHDMTAFLQSLAENIGDDARYVHYGLTTSDVWDTANELMRVTSSAREKTATVDELTGSTITITSLGAMGGLGATPIINHPEVSIVSIHAARDRAVVREGEIVVRRMMNLTASFDHRIIDGYDGALLIQELKSMLEYPATIFM